MSISIQIELINIIKFNFENYESLYSTTRVNLFHRKRVHLYNKSACAHFCANNSGAGWVDGWVGEWMDGWMGGRAGLRISYSN